MPNDANGISREVPDELLVSVLVGQLDERTAIERGRRAAKAGTEGERRATIFGTMGSVVASCMRPLPVTPPWFEP